MTATEPQPRVYVAHLCDLDIDAALWVHTDGTMELATRPGHQRHDVQWSRGSELVAVGR